MGWNLPFVDAAKTLRSFQSPDGSAVAKDASGWPLADARTVLMDMRPYAEWQGFIEDPEEFRSDVSGVYKCSFTGQADVEKVEGPFTIGPVSYNEATNTSFFDLTVDPVGPHHGLVFIKFVNTRRTPSAALNTGFTNFKAIRPGYDANTTQLFTNEFMSALNNDYFSTVRTMGFTETNNSNPYYPEQTHWANRRKVDASTYSSDVPGQESGAPWEVVVDLANTADIDLWINVPVAATDNYINELATLIKNRLEPERNLYVEYSNEVWNWGFRQSSWNNKNAEAQGLNYIEGYAKRTAEIAVIFRDVFGPESLNNKVRVINAWQIGYNPPDAQYEKQMTYINENFGPPEELIYALGVAPYFSCGDACDTGTPEEILAAMKGKSDGSAEDRRLVAAVASKWQLPGGMVAYEAGSDTGGSDPTNVENRIRAERAPGMKDMMLYDTRVNWFPEGGGLYMYLELASKYSRHGSWGLTDDIKNVDRNYKYDAVRELAGTGTVAVPAAPAGLKATAGNGKVSLSWTPSSGADSYKVKRSTTSGSSYSVIASPATAGYTDNGVTNGTTYYYVVSAVNQAGESANSAQVSATPAATSGTGITREYWTGIGGVSVSEIPLDTEPDGTDILSSLEGPVNWGDNYGTRIRAFVKPAASGNYTFYISGDDNAEVWLSTNAEPANKVKIAEVSGWTTSRDWGKYPGQKSAAIALTANTKYYVEVLHKERTGGDNIAVGWTGPGISDISVIGGENLLPYVPEPPAAPANLEATAGNESVSLSWTAVSGATSYNIQRSTGGNFYDIATGVTSSSYQDNNLINGTTYYYTVTAVNENGEGGASNAVSATPSAQSSNTAIIREYWLNVPGNLVSDIPLNTEPDGTDELNSLEGPVNIGDEYGARIRAYVRPATSGSYTFYIAGDDNAELWLSTDADPENKVKVAGVPGWTYSRTWTKYPEQKSAAISLTANTNYYVEVLHKERTGGDNIAVGWTGPGISDISVIGGENLVAYSPGGGTLFASDDFSSPAGTLHGVSSGSGWSAPWKVQNSDTSIPGYNISAEGGLSYENLSTSGNFAIGGDRYQKSGRGLDVSPAGPFSDYLAGDLIGAEGKTLFISFLLRKDSDNNEPVHVQLHSGKIVTYTNPALVSVGYFGAESNEGSVKYWSLKTGSDVIRSNIPVVAGETALLVLKLDFAATTTASLFVNPASTGGKAPATASASVASATSLAFKSFVFYGGNSTNQGAIDEIRMGDTYSIVTPAGLSANSVASGYASKDGFQKKAEAADQFFPNPAHDILNLRYTADQDQDINILITDAAGRSVLKQNKPSEAGLNQIQLDVSQLPRGLYFVNIYKDHKRTVKMIFLK